MLVTKEELKNQDYGRIQRHPTYLLKAELDHMLKLNSSLSDNKDMSVKLNNYIHELNKIIQRRAEQTIVLKEMIDWIDDRNQAK